MTKHRSSRRLAGLARLRTSLKRAHNVLNLVVPELDAWRFRLLALEGRDKQDYVENELAAEAEAAELAGAGWVV